jgi:hypothetical protein
MALHYVDLAIFWMISILCRHPGQPIDLLLQREFEVTIFRECRGGLDEHAHQLTVARCYRRTVSIRTECISLLASCKLSTDIETSLSTYSPRLRTFRVLPSWTYLLRASKRTARAGSMSHNLDKATKIATIRSLAAKDLHLFWPRLAER